ncbi:uncharacterized protein KY384_001077 [Bacidia gigantensis]|uniref:uncharacterized protein n=1 Tax=Bacidia gigantensis TaxID=2732470 RepID=UPI001D04E484|nr:uncharacterized protein KY384_001077 [Bacidia gigantensis]KAG8534233.1 hypothetical protein KY384_001077 [Bacidia gigantensis]
MTGLSSTDALHTSRKEALAHAEIIDSRPTDRDDTVPLNVIKPATSRVYAKSGHQRKRSKLADHEQIADIVLAQTPSQAAGHVEQYHSRPIRVSSSLGTKDGAISGYPPIRSKPSIQNERLVIKTRKTKREYNRGPKKRWTDQETNDLKAGVALCGVGNWKKILDHPRFHFGEGRTYVDLKDKFRTLFPPDKPERWAQAAKETLTERPDDNSTHDRLIYRLWTDEEDARLDLGFEVYGFQWQLIVQDESLRLSQYRPDQVRDRFRRRHPDEYDKPSRVSKLMMPKKRQGRPRKDQRQGGEGDTDTVMLEKDQSHPRHFSEGKGLPSISIQEDDAQGTAGLPPLDWDNMAVRPIFDL